MAVDTLEFEDDLSQLAKNSNYFVFIISYLKKEIPDTYYMESIDSFDVSHMDEPWIVFENSTYTNLFGHIGSVVQHILDDRKNDYAQNLTTNNC